MARIDDLPADQQAVLRLLLTQDRSYEEIARTLRMAPAAVRDRAHEAIATLGPAGAAPGPARRSQIGDYLLGQQDAAAQAATREALEGDAGDRGWARVVAGELRGVATRELPDVPDAPGAGTPARSADSLLVDPAPAPPKLTREHSSGSGGSRRRGALLLGALGVLAALAIGFFVGRATKGDDSGSTRTTSTQAAARDVIGQANLVAAAGSNATKALGVAQFVNRNGQNVINVLAQGLPTSPKGSGYGVWLTGGGQKPLWLGYFQAVTTSGQVGAQSTLKVNPRLYKTVEITREEGRNPTTPGSAYLSGQITFRSK